MHYQVLLCIALYLGQVSQPQLWYLQRVSCMTEYNKLIILFCNV